MPRFATDFICSLGSRILDPSPNFERFSRVRRALSGCREQPDQWHSRSSNHFSTIVEVMTASVVGLWVVGVISAVIVSLN